MENKGLSHRVDEPRFESSLGYVLGSASLSMLLNLSVSSSVK
jgi:hypothetical protein